MKTIVMTGGTNGIGLAAARKLLDDPGIRLLVGARGTPPPGIACQPLDLASLASVRAFAAAVEEWLGGAQIDGLVLNAAVHFADTGQRTVDGFETTFAVNHLAHYLLLRLLMPRLAPGAIVVVTTSNLHDPKTNSMAPPEHADAARLARGEGELGAPKASNAGLRVYAASKLCNVLMARALARDPAIKVIAFNPGFTPGTQFLRHRSSALQFLVTVGVPILSFVQRFNTVQSGGDFLADMVTGRVVPPLGALYASQIKRRLTWPPIAEIAQDDAVVEKLWHDSAPLVGLPHEPAWVD